jgi:hypothetical protein
MSNTRKFAERELLALSKSSIDPNNRPIIERFIPELIALCDKFGQSGQSGGSAGYVASALSKAVENLCMQKPICPLTGFDEEWVDVSDISDSRGKEDIMYQNSRCSALFKNGNGQVWYLDAISWREEKGSHWSGKAILPNGEKIGSHQFIKKFPFEPKTFYVDIISKKTKDRLEFFVKDESQLLEVFNYYKNPWGRKVIVEKY